MSKPAKSPGLSKTGPDVILISTSNSLARICARVVLPNPGGPCNNVWSKASFLLLEAATKTSKFLITESCPLKSKKVRGLRALSISNSSDE